MFSSFLIAIFVGALVAADNPPQYGVDAKTEEASNPGPYSHQDKQGKSEYQGPQHDSRASKNEPVVPVKPGQPIKWLSEARNENTENSYHSVQSENIKSGQKIEWSLNPGIARQYTPIEEPLEQKKEESPLLLSANNPDIGPVEKSPRKAPKYETFDPYKLILPAVINDKRRLDDTDIKPKEPPKETKSPPKSSKDKEAPFPATSSNTDDQSHIITLKGHNYLVVPQKSWQKNYFTFKYPHISYHRYPNTVSSMNYPPFRNFPHQVYQIPVFQNVPFTLNPGNYGPGYVPDYNPYHTHTTSSFSSHNVPVNNPYATNHKKNPTHVENICNYSYCEVNESLPLEAEKKTEAQNVIYTPSLGENVMSGYKLCEEKYCVEVVKGEKTGKIYYASNVLVKGTEGKRVCDSLYSLKNCVDVVFNPQYEKSGAPKVNVQPNTIPKRVPVHQYDNVDQYPTVSGPYRPLGYPQYLVPNQYSTATFPSPLVKLEGIPLSYRNDVSGKPIEVSLYPLPQGSTTHKPEGSIDPISQDPPAFKPKGSLNPVLRDLTSLKPEGSGYSDGSLMRQLIDRKYALLASPKSENKPKDNSGHPSTSWKPIYNVDEPSLYALSPIRPAAEQPNYPYMAISHLNYDTFPYPFVYNSGETRQQQ